MKSRAFGTAACALLAAITFESAMAFQLLDPPRRWFPSNGEPRVVLVDTGGLVGVNDSDKGVSAAIGAAEAWNDPSGAKALSVIDAQGMDNTNVILGDNISEMVFADPFGVCERTCLAATFTGYYDTNQTATCDGFAVVKIEDADIVFNEDPGFGPFRIGWTSVGEVTGGDGCSNETYIETVTSHEVGHLIGLAHEDQGVALMNPSVGSCDNKAILTDDIAGRDKLYDCTFNSGGSGSCGDGICDSDETAAVCSADCAVCGDGLKTGSEVCDIAVTYDCASLGFVNDGETAGCNNCEGYDTSSCTDCAGSETSCTDGVDNDCDGAVDGDDSDCSVGGNLPKGESCTVNGDCASGKCKGKQGAKTCK
jgi:hypothetical protein